MNVRELRLSKCVQKFLTIRISCVIIMTWHAKLNHMSNLSNGQKG